MPSVQLVLRCPGNIVILDLHAFRSVSVEVPGEYCGHVNVAKVINSVRLRIRWFIKQCSFPCLTIWGK